LIERTLDDGLFRVLSNNINGSQMSQRGFDVAPDIDVTDDLGGDVSALQETKKPWNAANRNKYNQQTQLKWPQGVRNVFSSAPWAYDEKDFMAGGTLLSLHGKVSGRVIEAEGDSLGRFCWATLRGSRDEGILLINAYRTCHVKSDNPGPFTSYQHEYTGLREQGIKDPQPRFQILSDLTTLIDRHREKGFRPVVMMDANEDWVAESHKDQGNKLKEFMQLAQLDDPFFQKFQHAPRTYVRGKHRLDYILIDPALMPAVRSIGYLGSMEANMSDHSMAYILISMKNYYSEE
jgi:endonuclease/exonuclease/phosphatase family metal-dependent hydrolase